MKNKETSSVFDTLRNYCSFYGLSSSLQNFSNEFFKTNQVSKKALIEQYQECLALIDTHDDDILLIRQVLRRCTKDITEMHQVSKTYLMDSQGSKTTIQRLINGQIKSVTFQADMLNELAKLLDTYPTLDLNDHLSLYDLKNFYHEREAHHNQVMALVETYLPEIYTVLNESKFSQPKISGGQI